MSFSQGFGDVRARARQGRVGEWALASHLNRTGFGINQDPQAAQVDTITVDTAANSTEYAFTLNGVSITYTSDASATKPEIADGLAAAVNAEPLVRGQVSAASDGVDLVTLTGLEPGEAFTLTESDSNLSTTSVTTADEADPIAFGVGVISQGFRTDEGERLVAAAAEGKFTAQVITVPVSYVASEVIRTKIYEVRGDERHLLAEWDETSATDQDTTLDAIATALNAALPANSVLVASDPATATQLVFTAEIAGLEFDVEVESVGGGASRATITKTNTTGPSPSTSVHRALAGVSLYASEEEAATVGGAAGQWAANRGVRYAQTGTVWVTSAESPSEGDTVYIELGASGTGQFYTSSGADRVALARSAARWERDGLTASDSLAALRLSL